jgi:hypothetical protein
MRFIEMTGRMLMEVINESELEDREMLASCVEDHSIIRVNQQGDIEVRRKQAWDVIGGLLGNFEARIRAKTGLDWV